MNNMNTIHKINFRSITAVTETYIHILMTMKETEPEKVMEQMR